MVTDLRIPEGIVVRTAKGGPDSLKAILADLKQYSFTGYVKVTLQKDIMSSIGYLVVEQGLPIMAVYEFEKSKPRELRRIYTGEKSLRFILEDSQDKVSNIELHSRVPSEEFERRFPDARIAEAPAKVAKIEAEEPVEEEEEPKVDAEREIIELWRRKGFNVDTLEAASNAGPAILAKELAAFEQDAQKLKQFEVVLNNFPVLGREEKAPAEYDLILKYQSTPENEPEKKCPRCGGPVEADGRCPKCSAEKVPTPQYLKPLPENMRFDNFIIGPGSKF